MSIEHATFAVERTYPVEPKKVWDAWASEDAKRQWFTLPAETAETTYSLTFGVEEHASTSFRDGPTFDFDATYVDVVEDERIVYTYDMHMNGRRISASIATVELFAEGDGTRLVVTEQGAYLDGLDQPEHREQGIGEQLVKIGELLG